MVSHTSGTGSGRGIVRAPLWREFVAGRANTTAASRSSIVRPRRRRRRCWRRPKLACIRRRTELCVGQLLAGELADHVRSGHERVGVARHRYEIREPEQHGGCSDCRTVDREIGARCPNSGRWLGRRGPSCASRRRPLRRLNPTIDRRDERDALLEPISGATANDSPSDEVSAVWPSPGIDRIASRAVVHSTPKPTRTAPLVPERTGDVRG